MNAESLTRHDLVDGLTRLGLTTGQMVMVHSSLTSLGRVEGGAKTVIDALLEVVGAEGTLLVPTHPARDGRTFDPVTIRSAMGLISETFRLRPDVIRSRHPYHPVAACGRHAEAMLQDHERSAAPDGPDTPYGRLISRDGWVLHIGCDLDTMTLLHAVEAELDLPYLRQIEMQYVDERGDVQTLHIERCPGGPRSGVLKFDRLFREQGAMRVGKIGPAVCRLISAPEAAAFMRREMQRDPCFAIGDNPRCVQSRQVRGHVKAHRLSQEDFQLVAPLWLPADQLDHNLSLIADEGISKLLVEPSQLPNGDEAIDAVRKKLDKRGFEIAVLGLRAGDLLEPVKVLRDATRWGAEHLLVEPPDRTAGPDDDWLDRLGELQQRASSAAITFLVINRRNSVIESPEQLFSAASAFASPQVQAGYRPADVAMSGISPFAEGLYQGKLRRQVAYLELTDVMASDGAAVPPGHGSAQLTQTISNFRCRSYDGFFCLRPLPGRKDDDWRAAAEGFWNIMDNI